jgi:hypothetical protein
LYAFRGDFDALCKGRKFPDCVRKRLLPIAEKIQILRSPAPDEILRALAHAPKQTSMPVAKRLGYSTPEVWKEALQRALTTAE